LAELEVEGAPPALHPRGARERTDKLVRELAINDQAPFGCSRWPSAAKVDYEAKAVMLGGRVISSAATIRRRRRMPPTRASIVAAFKRQLTKGDKALVGNTGYRRYLKTISDEHFAIDASICSQRGRFSTNFDEPIRGHVFRSFPRAGAEEGGWKTASRRSAAYRLSSYSTGLHRSLRTAPCPAWPFGHPPSHCRQRSATPLHPEPRPK